MATIHATYLTRANLFRLLGDEDRLRLLALCADNELTVSELANITGESQPQVTKKTQPLRDAGLLVARRDGARVLLRTQAVTDAVVEAAIADGRALCVADGSLSRVAGVVSSREEISRRAFEVAHDAPVVVDGSAVLPFLPALKSLLPRARLAVDIGTGEGALLPMLSPLYERVIAVDRSAARLARCALTLDALSLPNVRLLESDVDDPRLLEEVQKRNGADLVLLSRVLRHLARPADAVKSAAKLLRPGGFLVVIDALPHEDETAREQGDVWLGFEPQKLKGFLEDAGLTWKSAEPLTVVDRLRLQTAVGEKPIAH